MRFGLRLLRRREEDPLPVGGRILTFVLHLESGVTGGTALAPRVATLPVHNVAASFPNIATAASLPVRNTTATFPARTTSATLPVRPKEVGDPEWLTSP